MGFGLVNTANFEVLPIFDTYSGVATFNVGVKNTECEDSSVDVCDYFVVGIKYN